MTKQASINLLHLSFLKFSIVALAMLFPAWLMAQYSTEPLSGEWTFYTYYNLKTKDRVFPPSEIHKPIKVVFLDDGKLMGNSFRTGISADYKLNGKNLSIENFEIQNEAKENTWGNIFLRVIPEVNRQTLKGDTLILDRDETKERLYFIRSSAYSNNEYINDATSSDFLMVPVDVLPYFDVFESNKWWVLKAEDGSRDSLYVSNYGKRFGRQSFMDDTRQVINFTVESSQGPSWKASLGATSKRTGVINFTPTDGSGPSSCTSNTESTIGVGKILSCYYQFEILNECTLNEKKYEKVLKISLVNSAESTPFSELYLIDKAGPIRIKKSDGKVFDIIKQSPSRGR